MRVHRATWLLWSVIVVRVSVLLVHYWRSLTRHPTLIVGWHAESAALDALNVLTDLALCECGVSELVLNLEHCVTISYAWRNYRSLSSTKRTVLALDTELPGFQLLSVLSASNLHPLKSRWESIWCVCLLQVVSYTYWLAADSRWEELHWSWCHSFTYVSGWFSLALRHCWSWRKSQNRPGNFFWALLVAKQHVEVFFRLLYLVVEATLFGSGL